MYCPDCGGNNLFFDCFDTCLDCQKTIKPCNLSKWDRYWLLKAKEHSVCSKDPSTKVAAIIIGKDNDVVSMGYNGFARKVKDDKERYLNREVKLKMVVHAEINAILFADRHRLQGSTLYTWPFMPCSNCAAIVINAGITKCVAPITPKAILDRWGDSLKLTETQFEEAGVELVLWNHDSEKIE